VTQFVLTVVILVAIFGVLAVALNLELGHAGMIDFGIVAYFAAGAYIFAILTQRPPRALDQYLFGFGFPVWVGVIGAGLAGALFAFVTGRLTLRLRGEYFALTTFAFAEVFAAFIVNERRFGNGTVGLVGLDRPYRDAVTFLDYDVFLALVFLGLLALTMIVAERLVHSPYGRTLRSIRDDELAALTSGKRVSDYRIQVFLVAAFAIGVAGAFYVWFTTLVTPLLFTAEVTFIVWIALVVGGVGSNWRAVFGVAVIILFEELVRLIPFSTVRSAQIATSLRLSGLGLLLIVFLRWQPVERLGRRLTRSGPLP
jgi:branched-chain amino acid transport system permease protein